MGDIAANLALGCDVALSLQNLAFAFAGCLVGTLIGVLPGVGPVATLSVLLPITFNVDPAGALIMLAGIYYGAQYGGSTTAILVNIPGETSSVVTTLDGHQMAKQGRAGVALGIAAIGSFFAGTCATLVIASVAPPLSKLALMFGPAEYFALMVLGLVFAVVLARGSTLKAIAMVLVGLLMSTVGTDLGTGEERMTLGLFELADGIDFAALAMGMFGVAEILRNLEHPEARGVLHGNLGPLLPSRADLRQSAGPVARGTLLGGALGILPGNGAVLGPFASYALEKKVARDPSRFGRGAIEGVAGPEAANNAAAQTAFIPLLTLGIPPNAILAIMVGAMTIHLPLIGLWVRCLKVPYRLMFPAIVLFCCIGIYSIRNSADALAFTAFFGFVGYSMSKLGFEPAPLLLGFVLGKLLEENLRRALTMAHGQVLVFLNPLEYPVTATLLAIAAAALVVGLASIRRGRDEAFQE